MPGRMTSPSVLSRAAQVAVAALVLLGWLGDSWVVAHSGFATSPRRGGPSTFVPAPGAYVMAALLYGMSAIGVLALLRHRNASWRATCLVAALYATAAAALSAALA